SKSQQRGKRGGHRGRKFSKTKIKFGTFVPIAQEDSHLLYIKDDEEEKDNKNYNKNIQETQNTEQKNSSQMQFKDPPKYQLLQRIKDHSLTEEEEKEIWKIYCHHLKSSDICAMCKLNTSFSSHSNKICIECY